MAVELIMVWLIMFLFDKVLADLISDQVDWIKYNRKLSRRRKSRLALSSVKQFALIVCKECFVWFFLCFVEVCRQRNLNEILI